MNVRPLRTPVAGEHLIAVEPGLSLFVAEHWRRRLNLFTGRSLTEAALNAEQAYRAGMLALRGLSVSPGVVQGLEADIETVIQRIPLPPLPGFPFPGGTRPRFRIVRSDFLQIAGGYGIAASGEDVLVPRPLRVPMNAVKPHGTDEQLRKNAAGEPATELGQLIAFARSEAAAGRSTALPPAGILVLEPVLRHSRRVRSREPMRDRSGELSVRRPAGDRRLSPRAPSVAADLAGAAARPGDAARPLAQPPRVRDLRARAAA